MHNRTEKEKEYLRERYGEYIVDGTAGECVTNDDGTYTLRINEQLLEQDPSGDTALEVLAHEYGHTLGESLENAVDEELKAYAFANLFMKHYLDVDYYSNFRFTTDTVHAESLYRLDLLTSHVGDPEILLAHLTGSRFGGHEPYDYLDYIPSNFQVQQGEDAQPAGEGSIIVFEKDTPASPKTLMQVH